MAIAYKVLGQAAPTTNANTNLITVGAGKEQIISTLTITNVTSASINARVFVRIAGAAAGLSNAIIYDASIAGNSVAAFTLGITLAATDVLTVRSSLGIGQESLVFTAFGSEIS